MGCILYRWDKGWEFIHQCNNDPAKHKPSLYLHPLSALSSQWVHNWFLSLRRESWLAWDSLPCCRQSKTCHQRDYDLYSVKKTHDESCDPRCPPSLPSSHYVRVGPGAYFTDNMEIKSLDIVSFDLFAGEISWRHHFPPEGSMPWVRYCDWDLQIRAVRRQRDPSCMCHPRKRYQIKRLVTDPVCHGQTQDRGQAHRACVYWHLLRSLLGRNCWQDPRLSLQWPKVKKGSTNSIKYISGNFLGLMGRAILLEVNK